MHAATSNYDSSELKRRTARESTSQKKAEGDYPVEGVPVLTYTGESNFIEWKDKLLKYLIRKYGRFGLFIQTEQHWVPLLELPAADQPMYHGYSVAQLRTATDVVISERSKLMARLETYKGEAYGAMWSTLTPEGEEAAEQHQDFAAAFMDMDPLLLFRVLKATHSTRLNQRGVEESKQEAFLRYSGIRINGDETLTQYTKRFELQLSTLAAVGHEYQPTPGAVARHFIMSLDKRYAEVKRDIINEERKGGAVAMPADLVSAVTRVREYVPMGRMDAALGAAPYPTVFTVGVDSDVELRGVKRCYLCRSDKHLQKDCPTRGCVKKVSTEIDTATKKSVLIADEFFDEEAYDFDNF